MKEIGGYFELEQSNGKEYYSDLIAVNSARHALLYILKAKNIKKIYIPHFLCDSVSALCDQENQDYEYYKIDANFMPIFNKRLEENEYLYLVNYYGQISNKIIMQYKNQYKNIIVDNVQAFFQKPVEDVDTIYSCRKFFGVPDGGYVYTNAILHEPLSLDISMNRMKHLLGRLEGKCAGDYYNDFKANDALFKNINLCKMSRLTHNILRGIDYEYICKKREENFKFLKKELDKYNKLSPNIGIGPYAYPFYVNNGMKIKKKLSEKKIFIATLWPNVLKMGDNTLERDYAENILPLPIDQRYDIDDMKRIVEELIKCLS